MFSRSFVFGLVLVALAVPLTGPAVAQGEAQDEAWRREPRDLSFQATPDGFTAESTRTSDRGDDELTVRFRFDEGRLDTRFVSTEPQNESVLTLGFAVVSVVEFEDANADGRYGFGDRIVQRLPLSEMETSSLTNEPRIAGGHVATATYALPPPDDDNASFPIGDGDGPDLLPRTLTLRFVLVPAPQQLADTALTPLDVRVELGVERFPFQESTTRLAVETRLSSSEPIDEAAATPRTVDSNTGPFGAFFEWDEAVRVDGTLRPAYATVQRAGAASTAEATDNVLLAFSYPRGESMQHPSTIGYTRTEAQITQIVERLVAGDWLLYTLGFAVTLVAVGVPAAKRLRES